MQRHQIEVAASASAQTPSSAVERSQLDASSLVARPGKIFSICSACCAINFACNSIPVELPGTCGSHFELAGSPTPLGPSPLQEGQSGVNFAVFSQHASEITLELFHTEGSPVCSFPLSSQANRTGSVWHIALEGLPRSGVLYGFRVRGEGGWETGHRWDQSRVMLDPYAPLISGRQLFAIRDEVEQYKPKVMPFDPFQRTPTPTPHTWACVSLSCLHSSP